MDANDAGSSPRTVHFGHRIVAFGVGILFVMIVLAYPQLRISFHRWRMQYEYNSFSTEQERALAKGLDHFEIPDSFQRYEHHRDQLVATKALIGTNFIVAASTKARDSRID